MIDWNLELVDQLEWHWDSQLRPRLDDLTDDEYFWQPVPGCWTVTPTAAPHFDRRRADRPAADHARTAEGALRQLDAGHDAWVRDVRELGPDGPARPQGDLSPPEYADAPIAKLVLHAHCEVIHHGAEVSLLRDLYEWRP